VASIERAPSCAPSCDGGQACVAATARGEGWQFVDLEEDYVSIRKRGFLVPRTVAAMAVLLAAVPGAAVALPTCRDLAPNPANGLAGNAQISALTAALQAAAVTNKPYCRVDFTFSGESRPSAGYLPGQSQQLKIRVGLPVNGADAAD